MGGTDGVIVGSKFQSICSHPDRSIKTTGLLEGALEGCGVGWCDSSFVGALVGSKVGLRDGETGGVLEMVEMGLPVTGDFVGELVVLLISETCSGNVSRESPASTSGSNGSVSTLLLPLDSESTSLFADEAVSVVVDGASSTISTMGLPEATGRVVVPSPLSLPTK